MAGTEENEMKELGERDPLVAPEGQNIEETAQVEEEGMPLVAVAVSDEIEAQAEEENEIIMTEQGRNELAQEEARKQRIKLQTYLIFLSPKKSKADQIDRDENQLKQQRQWKLDEMARALENARFTQKENQSETDDFEEKEIENVTPGPSEVKVKKLERKESIKDEKRYVHVIQQDTFWREGQKQLLRFRNRVHEGLQGMLGKHPKVFRGLRKSHSNPSYPKGKKYTSFLSTEEESLMSTEMANPDKIGSTKKITEIAPLDIDESALENFQLCGTANSSEDNQLMKDKMNLTVRARSKSFVELYMIVQLVIDIMYNNRASWNEMEENVQIRDIPKIRELRSDFPDAFKIILDIFSGILGNLVTDNIMKLESLSPSEDSDSSCCSGPKSKFEYRWLFEEKKQGSSLSTVPAADKTENQTLACFICFKEDTAFLCDETYISGRIFCCFDHERLKCSLWAHTDCIGFVRAPQEAIDNFPPFYCPVHRCTGRKIRQMESEKKFGNMENLSRNPSSKKGKSKVYGHSYQKKRK